MQRQPSQRTSAETRAALADAAEAQRLLAVKTGELTETDYDRNYWKKRALTLDAELKERGDGKVPKLGSQSARDRYAAEIAAHLERFDVSDIAQLTMLALVGRRLCRCLPRT